MLHSCSQMTGKTKRRKTSRDRQRGTEEQIDRDRKKDRQGDGEGERYREGQREGGREGKNRETSRYSGRTEDVVGELHGPLRRRIDQGDSQLKQKRRRRGRSLFLVSLLTVPRSCLLALSLISLCLCSLVPNILIRV